jgi:hypothetical protein
LWARIAFLSTLTLPLLHADEEAEASLLIPVEAEMRVVRVEKFDAEGNSWSTIAIAHLNGQDGTVKVRIPAGLERSELRITASPDAMFPAELMRHRETVKTRTMVDSSLARNAPIAWTTFGAIDAAVEEDTSSATVQESDIWRLRGNMLYFYNHARGLQIYDLSNPDSPTRVGTLDFAGRGEQMYVLDDNHVILLANSPDPAVVVVRVNDGDPRIIAEESISDSSFLESRLVGDRLYFATQHYSFNETENEYRYNVRVNAIDFADAGNPQTLAPLDLPVGDGWGNVLTATPDHMLISVGRSEYEESEGTWWRRGWRQFSEIYVVDLQTADGAPALVDSVEFDGYLNDKHKFDLSNNVLTVIGQAQRFSDTDGRWIRNTILETFTLAGSTLTPAGSIELAPNETLFATLIDGDRAYVVTFLVKDPLFAIDLSDPTNPTILGQLDVPGYSSILKLLDDRRLFSVGIEERRVAASLFAIDDPSNLSLLSRAYIGEDGENSWTEANYDDRAVTILPEQNLALLPYSSYDSTGNNSSGIQIFSLSGNTITARGKIAHENWARRAGALDTETLVSISESELYTIDIADLDAPTLLAEEKLSWYTNRLFRVNGYLMQFDTNSNWSGENASLIVSTVEAPDVAAAELSLEGIQPIGFAQRGDWLYAAGIRQSWDNSTSTYATPVLQVAAINCADPLNPLLSALTTTELTGIEDHFSTQLKPIWIDDTTLLWAPANGPSSSYYYPYIDIAAPIDPRIGIIADIAIWPGYGYGPRRPLFASFSVEEPGTPALLDWILPSLDSNPWEPDLSDVFVTQSTAFFTQRRFWYDFIPVVGEDGVERNEYQAFQENTLRTIDFSDPADLKVSEGFEINGTLEGVASVGAGGYLALTAERISEYNPDSKTTNSYDTVSAYAFDGAQLLLVDEVEWGLESNSPFYWNSDLAASDRTLYRPVNAVEESNSAAIERLRLDDSGQWVADTSLSVEGQAISSFGKVSDRLFAFSDTATSVWNISAEPVVETFAAAYPAPGNLSADRVSYTAGEDLLIANDYFGVLSLALTPVAETDFGAAPETSDDSIRETLQFTIDAANVTFSEPQSADFVGRLGEDRWRFRSSLLSSPDEGAVDHGEGWRESAWYGWFLLSETGSWVYHLEHGWNYNIANSSGSWSYDRALGWTWITASAYPFVYSADHGSWLYYLRGSGEGGKRWFYDFGENVRDWIAVDRS